MVDIRPEAGSGQREPDAKKDPLSRVQVWEERDNLA